MSDSIKKYFENATSTMGVKTDPIVDEVIYKLRSRSSIGIEKYGTTLADSKQSKLEFMVHLQEELFDACLYIETLLNKYNNATKDET